MCLLVCKSGFRRNWIVESIVLSEFDRIWKVVSGFDYSGIPIAGNHGIFAHVVGSSLLALVNKTFFGHFGCRVVYLSFFQPFVDDLVRFILVKNCVISGIENDVSCGAYAVRFILAPRS